MLSLWSDEKIIRVFNHHPAVIAPHIALSFAIVILNFFLMYWLFLQGLWGAILFAAVLFSVAFYLFRLIFLFRRNRVLVTNRRVAVEEAPSLFQSSVAEFPYTRIAEAKAIFKGLGQTLLRYGNVKIHSLSGGAPFVIYQISEPMRLQNMINERLSLVEEKIEKPAETVFVRLSRQAKELSPEEKERLLNDLKQ